MGAFGPRRVNVPDAGESAPPPAGLVDNESTLLDLTDLVFIDPVSTGYSRAAEEKNSRQYHGVQEDVSSVGEFIRLFVAKHNRWPSPKYLAGESYGTTRAAGQPAFRPTRRNCSTKCSNSPATNTRSPFRKDSP
jgi:carboxypeptidase C (cathepsin A)